MKNKRGFTLIELLAVIVIMGVLMWGAVTAYGKIMENSKKDVFVTTVGAYVDAIGNYKLAGALNCGNNSFDDKNNTFVFYIATSLDAIDTSSFTNEAGRNSIVNQTLKLMEKGGKSSWNNADVFGYVTFKKNDDDVTEYKVSLNDVAGNGTGSTAIASPTEVNKSHISSSSTNPTKLTSLGSSYIECTLAD